MVVLEPELVVLLLVVAWVVAWVALREQLVVLWGCLRLLALARLPGVQVLVVVSVALEV